MNTLKATHLYEYRIRRAFLRFWGTILLIFAGVHLHSQATWTGESPGRGNDWMDPKNWEQSRLPDALDKVIIPYRPGKNNKPVLLRNQSLQIAALELQSGSRLEISKDSKLIIDGSEIYDYGILLLGGTLYNEGEITIVNAALASIEKLNGVLINKGKIRIELAGDLLDKTGAGQAKNHD